MKAKRIAEITADIVKLKEQFSMLAEALKVEHGLVAEWRKGSIRWADDLRAPQGKRQDRRAAQCDLTTLFSGLSAGMLCYVQIWSVL